MSDPAKPSASASVIFAAVVAILAGLLVLLSMSAGFLEVLLDSEQIARLELAPFLRNAALVFMAFAVCLSAFGIATGIGLILLRNWARISVLIWGGFSVFFGLFGVAIAFLMPLPPTPEVPNLPAGTMQGIRFFMLCIYGLPVIVGVWWLILFNRKSVKAQFAGTADPLAAQKPRPPVPVSILAWLYITAAAHIVILPFLPFSMPLILFGHFFSGTIGTLAYVFVCLISAVVGVGLLKLKPWSYPLTIGFQLFGLANGIVTVLHPNYQSQLASWLDRINNAMHLPPNPYYTPEYFLHLRWITYIGFLIPVAIVGMLFYYRERFLEAASAAASRSGQPIPS